MVNKILTVLGRSFISAGILVFLFVAYQLWGTGLAEARSQDHLKAQADKELGALTSPTTAAPGHSTASTTAVPAPPPAPSGSFVAVIKIPKINLQKYVVEGTGVPDLKKGPGHYTNTPLPGQPGNAAIAGHRTTYGAPFGDIGELQTGDEIDVTTKQGSFRYKVSQMKVVDPSDTSVLNKTSDNRLTLTTCHPKYSAAKRLVVIATLDDKPALAPPPTTAAPSPPKGDGSSTAPTTAAPSSASEGTDLEGADLSGTATSKVPAILWAGIVALTALGIWGFGRLTNRWVAYIIGAPIFLVVLFVFFENFSRLLPANA